LDISFLREDNLFKTAHISSEDSSVFSGLMRSFIKHSCVLNALNFALSAQLNVTTPPTNLGIISLSAVMGVPR
jgi:hypothetical protein